MKTRTRDFLNDLPDQVTVKGIFRSNKVFVDGKVLSLKKSLKVRRHSPTGFNWGYGGSGPAQFALALLLKYVSADIATDYYQALKFKWVGSLPRTDFIVVVNLREIMRGIVAETFIQTEIKF